jgi:hypothetical protein
MPIIMPKMNGMSRTYLKLYVLMGKAVKIQELSPAPRTVLRDA